MSFENEKMLAVKETAYVLGVSRDSVTRLIKRGKIRGVPFPAMGGKGKNFTWRIPMSSVSDFMSANMR